MQHLFIMQEKVRCCKGASTAIRQTQRHRKPIPPPGSGRGLPHLFLDALCDVHLRADAVDAHVGGVGGDGGAAQAAQPADAAGRGGGRAALGERRQPARTGQLLGTGGLCCCKYWLLRNLQPSKLALPSSEQSPGAGAPGAAASVRAPAPLPPAAPGPPARQQAVPPARPVLPPPRQRAMLAPGHSHMALRLVRHKGLGPSDGGKHGGLHGARRLLLGAAQAGQLALERRWRLLARGGLLAGCKRVN